MHIPVMKEEVIRYLDPKPDENFIDCTIGFAGHTAAILQKNGPNGKVLGIEIDKDVYELTKSKIAEILNSKSPKESKKLPTGQAEIRNIEERLVLVNGSYANLKEIVEQSNFYPVNGILLDLGMSSWDLEQSGRGFSFLKDEILDMRYQVQSSEFPEGEPRRRINSLRGKQAPYGARQVQSLTAEEIVNKWPEGEIARILKEYGQERFAKNIAKKIVETRCQQSIETTFQLVEVIRKSFPRSCKFGKQPRRRAPKENKFPTGQASSLRGRHFATKTFQALRIAVNNELENLKIVLPQALNVLGPGGRLAIISFHSLEDRIIKNFFKEEQYKNTIKILTKKPIIASAIEIAANPRARSAKLRAAIKTLNSKL